MNVTKEIVVNRDTFKYPDYIYRNGRIVPPSSSFEGMSLEEIKKQFGRDTAQGVYHMACLGYDLTKVQEPYLPTEDLITIKFLMVWKQFRMILMQNDFTVAKDPERLILVEVTDMLLEQRPNCIETIARDVLNRIGV